jgi:hypothetical protein
MPNKPGNIQFITLAHPRDTTSVKTQRRAHSHAARTAHARARQLRTIEYQAAKIRQTLASEETKDREITPKDNVISVFNSVEAEKPTLPSPISLLASDRRDPFNSFARSFKPIEHFLLDQCEPLDHLYDHYYRRILPLYTNLADALCST